MRAFIESKELNGAELARLLNLSYDKIASYLSGKAEPGSEFWRHLVGKFPDADVAYLLTGIKEKLPVEAAERLVPIVDKIPAGPITQGFGEEGIVGRVETELRDPDAFALIVHGVSMWPQIEEGDIVICSPRAPFVNGRIYAVVTKEGEHSLKTVRHDERSESYALIPANREFPTVYIPQDHVLRLIRVTEIRRNLQ